MVSSEVIYGFIKIEINDLNGLPHTIYTKINSFPDFAKLNNQYPKNLL